MCAIRYSASMVRGSRRIIAALGVMVMFGAFVALALVAPAVRASLLTTAPVRLETLRLSGTLSRGTSHSSSLPIRADMIGASWRGARDLELSARGADGRWSRWVELADDGDGPDPGSREARAQRGRHVLAVPIWVGDADRVRVRVAPHAPGRARDVRLELLNVSGTATTSSRALSTLRSTAARVLGPLDASAGAAPRAPRIHTRSAWKARSPAAQPSLAPRALGVVVHHTVSANRYACSQVPALLRGIQRYHMDSNGWNDIGYNYLIDRCGGVWEGRAGGLTSAVIGAHTAGFNTGTVGIALIGTHSSVRPSDAARSALIRLTSWRMDVAHVAPTGTMLLTARTADRFPIDSSVSVRAMSGHRDLFPTSCPGAFSYRDLTALARSAWLHGGAKVANVTTAPVMSDPGSGLMRSVRVRAIANVRDAAMTVRVERISDGAVLGSTFVRASSVTLDAIPATPTPIWDVRVVANAARTGERARSVVTTLGDYGSDPGFTLLTTPPPTLTHGADPAGTLLHLSYSLATEQRVTARLIDPTTGARVATLLDQTLPASSGDGVLNLRIPATVLSGGYELRVGVQSDTAPGRSEDRFAVTLTPPA